MKYFLDTNIFLRYFTEESNSKILDDCASLIKNIKLGHIKGLTSHLVLAEIVWTLPSAYNSPKKQVLRVLKSIDSFNLKLDNKTDSTVANKLFEQYPVKYIDALIASNPEIQSKKMTIISYDKDFDKLGVKRLEPKDVI